LALGNPQPQIESKENQAVIKSKSMKKWVDANSKTRTKESVEEPTQLRTRPHLTCKPTVFKDIYDQKIKFGVKLDDEEKEDEEVPKLSFNDDENGWRDFMWNEWTEREGVLWAIWRG